MMIPTTGKEARRLGLPRYFTGIKCKRGHLSDRYSDGGQCIACDKERDRPEGQRQSTIKRYYEKNKEKCMAATKRWKKSSGMAYEYTKRSRAKNPALVYFANAKRHASKLQRTPPWLNAGELFEIQCIYKYCSALRGIGLKYEVDHVVPLQGDLVSGLHVPWNMQILTSFENGSKGNRFC